MEEELGIAQEPQSNHLPCSSSLLDSLHRRCKEPFSAGTPSYIVLGLALLWEFR